MRPVSILLLFSLTLFYPTRVLPQVDTRYGGEPLLLGAGARPMGMGSAFVAISNDATATYWNPAGLAGLEANEFQAQHAERFGGAINHDVFTLASPYPIGGFGIGLTRLGVDNIKLTALENPSAPAGSENRPVVTRVETTTDYALYLSYGRRIHPDLAVGASFKLIWRNLAVGDGSGYGIDIGLLYNLRPGITFGMSIRNLTRTKIAFDSGSNDKIPPSAWLGIAYARRVPSLKGDITLSTSLHLGEQTSSVTDTQAFRVGAEYLYKQILAFRTGVEGTHFTAGTGLKFLDRFSLDLAFLEHDKLDNTYRVSASVYF
jgi:hypothetical protein